MAYDLIGASKSLILPDFQLSKCAGWIRQPDGSERRGLPASM